MTNHPPTTQASAADLWIVACVVGLVLAVLAASGSLRRTYPEGSAIGLPISPMTEATLGVGDAAETSGQSPAAAAQAVRQVVLDFYRAWARGDEASARKLSTPKYATRITAKGFGNGYEQYDTRILDTRRISQNHWQVTGSEVFLHPLGDRFTQRSTVDVVRTVDGWQISDWKVAPVEPHARISASRDASFVVPQKTIEGFFAAWQKGNVAAIRKLMTPEMAQRGDIDDFAVGHRQLKMDIVDRGRFSNTKWQVTVMHVAKKLKAGPFDPVQTTRYRLSLELVDGHWLVSDLWVVSQQQAALPGA